MNIKETIPTLQAKDILSEVIWIQICHKEKALELAEMFLEQANVDLDIICKTEFSSCRRTLQLKNGEWIWGPAEHIYVDVVCCYFVA